MLIVRRLLHDGVDSQVELEALAGTIGRTPGPRDRFGFFVKALHDLCHEDFEIERRKWINTYRDDVKVYTGETTEPTPGRVRIWAAIEVSRRQGVVTLLMTSDGYTGHDHWLRLAQAIDRLDNGQTGDWQ